MRSGIFLKNWARLVEYMAKSLIWWERAHEYRALAEEVSDPGRRESYMTISQNCARVARRLEELETIIEENPQSQTEADLISPLAAARPQPTFSS
jgi:hypothetical protein